VYSSPFLLVVALLYLSFISTGIHLFFVLELGPCVPDCVPAAVPIHGDDGLMEQLTQSSLHTKVVDARTPYKSARSPTVSFVFLYQQKEKRAFKLVLIVSPINNLSNIRHHFLTS
jgi:hypothetical protein